MNSNWHKMMLLGALFIGVGFLNTKTAHDTVRAEPRISNLVSIEATRLSPQQTLAINRLENRRLAAPLPVSRLQAFAPAGGGPIEVTQKEATLPITALLVLVTDLDTGERFYEYDADRRWPLASLSKMMTAVVATRLVSSSELITIADADFNPLDTSTNHALKVDQQYVASDLVRAMLVASANEAAEALIRSYGREKFIEEMRRQAVLWGMTETYFGDPTGLSAANQSTPDDLEIFLGHLWREYPELLEISRSPNIRLKEWRSGGTVTLYATHRFAGEGNFLGGKTGYTDTAKENLISIFRVAGRPIAIIVMASDERFTDTTRLLDLVRARLSP